MGKFKDFINGFRKIEYDYPLPDHFDKDTFMYDDNMYKAISDIEDEVSNFPIRNPTYGILDFKAILLNDRYKRKVETSKKGYLSFYKQSYQKYSYSHLIENDCLITIIFKALDNKIWKFTVKTYFTYYSYTNTYDFDILNLEIRLANAFLKDIHIENILDKDMNIDLDDLIDTDKISYRDFIGYIKTYGDYDYFKNYGIKDIIDTDNNEDMINLSYDETESEEDYLKDNAITTEVVRRNY